MIAVLGCQRKGDRIRKRRRGRCNPLLLNMPLRSRQLVGKGEVEALGRRRVRCRISQRQSPYLILRLSDSVGDLLAALVVLRQIPPGALPQRLVGFHFIGILGHFAIQSHLLRRNRHAFGRGRPVIAIRNRRSDGQLNARSLGRRLSGRPFFIGGNVGGRDGVGHREVIIRPARRSGKIDDLPADLVLLLLDAVSYQLSAAIVLRQFRPLIVPGGGRVIALAFVAVHRDLKTRQSRQGLQISLADVHGRRFTGIRFFHTGHRRC